MLPSFNPLTAFLLTLSPLLTADLLEWARNPITGRWIGFASSTKTWSASEAQAESMQGHLLTVHGSAENAWTLQTFHGLSTSDAWIGLSDIAVEGTFTWTSGAPVTYTHFAPGEPDDAGGNEDGVSFDLATGEWHDRPLASLRTYLVERSAAPTSGWSAPVGYFSPNSSGQVWTYDIDGDGRKDLLVVGNNSSAQLCWFLQQQGGSFSLAGCASISFSPVASAIGDFDGDGWIDVVCAGGVFGGFNLNRGLPGGGFAPEISIPTMGTVTALTAADLDLDGHADLVVARFVGFQNFLSVMGGGSPAGFAQVVDMPVLPNPYDLDVGDMNGDGLVDIHATSSAVAPYDQTFFGQGTLTLLPGPTFAGGTTFGRAALADLDGDGDLDVAYRSSYPSQSVLNVAWNDGAGNLTAGPVIAATDLNGNIAAADLDGDGIGDVIASESGAKRIAIVRSLGGGAFAAPEYLALQGSPFFIAAADVRGDASPELVTVLNMQPAGYQVTLLENLAPDCNGNGVDDPRDIELGVGTDADANGALDDCQPAGEVFCAGDGTAAGCPCTASTPHGAGCANSTGQGGRLTAIGLSSLAADSLRIEASGLPATTTARLVQGTTGVNGGSGGPFGDGLQCAGGALVRIGQRTASAGTVAFGAGVPGDVAISTSGSVTPGRRTYQAVYRDVMPFCTSAGFNTTNGLNIEWLP